MSASDKDAGPFGVAGIDNRVSCLWRNDAGRWHCEVSHTNGSDAAFVAVGTTEAQARERAEWVLKKVHARASETSKLIADNIDDLAEKLCGIRTAYQHEMLTRIDELLEHEQAYRLMRGVNVIVGACKGLIEAINDVQAGKYDIEVRPIETGESS